MSTTTVREIITFAIQNEIEAYEFYRDAAKKITTDKNLAATFEELAIEEQKHRDFLEGLLTGEINEFPTDDISDYNISEGVEKPKLTTNMKFADAIALAMKKEEEAMNMYKKFAECSTDQHQKELFLNLSKMEATHKVRLEDIFVNAAYAEVW
jgi:rubrerythrin